MTIKNARTVYDFDCPVCKTSLVYQTTDKISGKTNRHLSISNCAVCEKRLSIDYSKSKNMVLATVKEVTGD